MGKLKTKKIVVFLKSWAMPFALVLVTFAIINSQISANPEPSKQELKAFLESNSLIVGAESVRGYQQIYYEYSNTKIFVTKDPYNHTQPVVSGRYIAWSGIINGFPQVFLYDILEKTELQITQTGTNILPSVSGGRVVWEGLDNGIQQVFYFDGFQIYQLSFDYTSLRPKIKNNTAIFAQYTGEENKPWRVISYDLTKIDLSDAAQIIKEGYEPDSWPTFTADGIKTKL